MSELGRRYYMQMSARHEVWALAPLFDGRSVDVGGPADHISMRADRPGSPGQIVSDVQDRLSSVERWVMQMAHHLQEAEGVFAGGEDEQRRAFFVQALGDFAVSHIPPNVKTGRLTNFMLEAVSPEEVNPEGLSRLREGRDLDTAVLIPGAEVVLRSTAERVNERVRNPGRGFGAVECLHALQCVRSMSSDGVLLATPRFVSIISSNTIPS